MTNYDPNEETQHDHLDPVSAVIAAWDSPWADAAWQEQCQYEIAGLMPALVRSLDRLVALMATKTVEPIETKPIAGGSYIRATEKVEEAAPRPSLYGEAVTNAVGAEADAIDKALVEEEEEQLDFAAMTLEELGQRGSLATQLIREYGSAANLRAARARETRIRQRILVYLNNRNELSQPMIAKMVGIGAPRISQIISDYYNRLEHEEHK